MAPSVKLALLALVGAAAAVPGIGHAKFHHRRDTGAYPVGEWPTNGTVTAYAVAVPATTGTSEHAADAYPVEDSSPVESYPDGATKPQPGEEEPAKSAVKPAADDSTAYPAQDETTTMTQTSTATHTLYKTVHASQADVSAAAVPAPQGGEHSIGPNCGPATITVTATAQYTVTVPPGAPASGDKAPTAYVVAQPVPSGWSETPKYSEAPAPAPAPEVPATDKPTQESYSPSDAPAAEPKPASTASASVVAVPVPTYEAVKFPETSGTFVVPSPVTESSAPETPAAAQPAETPVQDKPANKPSTTPSYSGSKRGLIYRYDGAAACKSFAGAGSFGFASNWEVDSRGDIGSVKFIPTLRSLDRVSEWTKSAPAALDAGSDTIFTFNEPDIGGQANLSPQAACDAWGTHITPMVAKYPNVKVVGPSISSADPTQNPGRGLNWLTAFSKECPAAQWQYANYHWYGPAKSADGKTGAQLFKEYIELAHNTINKPFYVSEFGLEPGSSEQDAAAFLEESQAYLDANANCVGYSYFAAGSFDTPHVLLGTADQPTMAGKVYLG